MRAVTVLKLAALAAFVLLVAFVQVVKSIDVDRYRGQVAGWAGRVTGRDIAFAGPLTLKLSLRPAIIAEGVTLSDRPGSGRPPMIRLDHVEAEIGLLPLLSGEVRLARLWVDGAELLLTADGGGHGNWEFAAGGDSDADMPAVAARLTQIALDHVRVRLRDGAEHALTVEHATLDSDGIAAPLALTLDGQWDGRRLTASGILGSLKDLLAAARPFPLQVKLLLPGMVASFNGTIRGDARQGMSLAMAVGLEVNDSLDLDPLLGVPLPSLGAARAVMTLAGRLDRPKITAIDATIGRHDALAIAVRGVIDDPVGGNGVDLALTVDGDAAASLGVTGQAGPIALALSGHVSSDGSGAATGWRIADLKGSLGHSDLAGQLSLFRRNGHDVVEGRFESAQVDLTRAADKAPEPGRVGGRVFSDMPLPLQFLLDNEGHLAWHIGRLRDRSFDAADIRLDLAWHDRAIAAGATVASVAGGSAEARLGVDGNARAGGVSLEVTLAHVTVGELLRQLAWSDAVAGGRVDFRLRAVGSGETPRSIFASLQGSSLLSVAPTNLANRLAQDGIGQVLAHLSPDPAAAGTELRCLISHFTLADGLARSEALLFALGPTLVTGQGSVNLASEGLDFTLTPRPAGSAAALDVGGSLAHPLVTASKGAIVKNLPPVVGATESPLLTLAANDGNPCFVALAQGRKGRSGGTMK